MSVYCSILVFQQLSASRLQSNLVGELYFLEKPKIIRAAHRWNRMEMSPRAIQPVLCHTSKTASWWGEGVGFGTFSFGSLNYTASENRPQHRAEPEPCRVCLVWLLLAVCWVVLLQAEVRDLRVILSKTST